MRMELDASFLAFAVRFAQPAARGTAVRAGQREAAPVCRLVGRAEIGFPPEIALPARAEQSLLGYFHSQPGFPFLVFFFFLIFFPRMKVKNTSSDMLL